MFPTLTPQWGSSVAMEDCRSVRLLIAVRTVVCLLAFAWIAPLWSGPAQAQSTFETEAKAAILLDYNTGAVLFRRTPTRRCRLPA